MSNKDKIYKVYKHTSPSDKVYIGITKQNPAKRWQNGRGYICNKYFYRAIQKYGWDNFNHEILFNNLTKQEAEQKEIELIAYYDSTNNNRGYNIDHGGNCIGSFSEEHKRKISEALTGVPALKIRGENHPMYGKHLSEETKRKISESKTGKPGHSLSEKNKQKISEAHSIPILQYNLDGNFIKKWDSAASASKELNIIGSNITACCKGSHKTAGGYIWKYSWDELKPEDIDKHKPFHYQCRQVEQYSLDGEFIAKYDSIKDAAIKNFPDKKQADSNICYCCSGKSKTAYGYIWRYA